MILGKVDSILQKVEKILTSISWVVTFFVMFMIVIDVLLRFFFNRPLPAAWEISEICMPYIVFLPFAYTLIIDTHVRVSLVKDRVSPKIRFGFEIFTNTISFVFCSVLTYISFLRFWQSFMLNEEIMAAIIIPWWLGKMAMPLGIGMFSIRYLMKLFLNLAHNK